MFYCLHVYRNLERINVRSPYVTPELNNELQRNVGNMWEKITVYLYALKTARRKHFQGLLIHRILFGIPVYD